MSLPEIASTENKPVHRPENELDRSAGQDEHREEQSAGDLPAQRPGRLPDHPHHRHRRPEAAGGRSVPGGTGAEDNKRLRGAAGGRQLRVFRAHRGARSGAGARPRRGVQHRFRVGVA